MAVQEWALCKKGLSIEGWKTLGRHKRVAVNSGPNKKVDLLLQPPGSQRTFNQINPLSKYLVAVQEMQQQRAINGEIKAQQVEQQ